MRAYEPEMADAADVPRIARAMAAEKKKGNDPLYLDMSPIQKSCVIILSKAKSSGWTISSAGWDPEQKPTCSARRRILRLTR